MVARLRMGVTGKPGSKSLNIRPALFGIVRINNQQHDLVGGRYVSTGGDVEYLTWTGDGKPA